MEDGKLILAIHEKQLKTERDLKYFEDECKYNFKRQRKINRFIVHCLILLMIKPVLRSIKHRREKGTANLK